jgi:hypothetical protein
MTNQERDEERRNELIKLVVEQIKADARSGNTTDLEILLDEKIDNSRLEDYLDYDTVKAFWKKYPVS